MQIFERYEDKKNRIEYLLQSPHSQFKINEEN